MLPIKRDVHSKPREIWRCTIKGRRAIRSKPLVLALSILLIWSITLAVRIHNKAGEEQNRLEVELQELENQNTDLEKQNENIKNQLEDEKKRADARVSERLAREKQTPKKRSVSLSGCEQYRGIVSQYPWDADTALFVMKKESGCNPNAVSPTNDHGLFQIHGEKIYDPAQNTARAYQKYEGGRVGANNFSAWYAVCSPGNNPQPKYAGIKCNG